jgi:alpha/beta superfamily hydrolase
VARRIESHFITGPAGPLESVLEEPEESTLTEACVVLHPHPLYGGTMHNKVVYRVARAMRKRGAVVLRFNFRGVPRSGGVHDQGVGEVDDARAALDWLRERYPKLPYSLAGFSFGSRVALQLACTLPDAERVIVVGMPTREGMADYLARCTTRKVFIQSTHDEHGPKEALEALYAQTAEPKELHWVEGGDHFFAGVLDELEKIVVEL